GGGGRGQSPPGGKPGPKSRLHAREPARATRPAPDVIRSLDQDVVAVAAVEDVKPVAAAQHGVPGPTVERVRAVAADEHVVPFVADGGELDRGGGQAVRLDH